jgi:hypothetical protein
VQFPAALLIVFAILFAAIARAPARNRNLIPYGVLLKLSYCGVISFHWLTAGLPDLWKPFCVTDLIFLIAFAWAWMSLRRDTAADAGSFMSETSVVGREWSFT